MIPTQVTSAGGKIANSLGVFPCSLTLLLAFFLSFSLSICPSSSFLLLATLELAASTTQHRRHHATPHHTTPHYTTRHRLAPHVTTPQSQSATSWQQAELNRRGGDSLAANPNAFRRDLPLHVRWSVRVCLWSFLF